MIDLA